MTKFSHLFAISTNYPTKQVAKLFFKEFFKLQGLSKNVVNNNDNIFMGAFWQELFRLVRTELTPSTNYHPQTNGQTEIVNKRIEGYLRNYVVDLG